MKQIARKCTVPLLLLLVLAPIHATEHSIVPRNDRNATFLNHIVDHGIRITIQHPGIHPHINHDCSLIVRGYVRQSPLKETFIPKAIQALFVKFLAGDFDANGFDKLVAVNNHTGCYLAQGKLLLDEINQRLSVRPFYDINNIKVARLEILTTNNGLAFNTVICGVSPHLSKNTAAYLNLTVYDVWGRDKEGYDRNGYNRAGYDREGYDGDGFKENAVYNKYGFDREGYDKRGYDRSGYDRLGYDIEGYDPGGYDSEGNPRQL